MFAKDILHYFFRTGAMCALYKDQKTGDSSIMVMGGKYIMSVKSSTETYSLSNDTFNSVDYDDGYPGEAAFGGSVLQVVPT